MASKNKTTWTGASVDGFIDAVPNATRRGDARALDALMREVSGAEPEMWGPTIIGYGRSTYTLNSGRTGDTPQIAFSPRSANLVLYVGMSDATRAELLPKLGKHKVSVSCLYVNRLSEVDLDVLRELAARGWAG